MPDLEREDRRDTFFILSGCSGGGKSALLAELDRRGHATVPEPGREIVKQQLSVGGDGLPWENARKFTLLLASRYVDDFLRMSSQQGAVFFDRALVEPVSYLESTDADVPEDVQRIARRYAKKVFMLPPWKEIYRTDAERRHSFEDALAEYSQLLPSYEALGYEIALVPKASVAERADFVLREALGSGS